jgi:hypothetical protein
VGIAFLMDVILAAIVLGITGNPITSNKDLLKYHAEPYFYRNFPRFLYNPFLSLIIPQ